MMTAALLVPKALERLKEWGGDKLAGQMVRLFLKNSGVRMDQLEDGPILAALFASGDETAKALAADPTVPGELRGAAGLDGALASCDVVGGTAPRRVAAELAAARKRLGV